MKMNCYINVRSSDCGFTGQSPCDIDEVVFTGSNSSGTPIDYSPRFPSDIGGDIRADQISMTQMQAPPRRR